MIEEYDNRREAFSISIKEFFTFLLAIGGLVSAWVSLNNSQVETDTKLKAFESYYKESLKEYRNSNEKSTLELKSLINEQKKINKDLIEQVNDLERSVTQIYRISLKK